MEMISDFVQINFELDNLKESGMQKYTLQAPTETKFPLGIYGVIRRNN
jgi:hypothetical protein